MLKILLIIFLVFVFISILLHIRSKREEKAVIKYAKILDEKGIRPYPNDVQGTFLYFVETEWRRYAADKITLRHFQYCVLRHLVEPYKKERLNNQEKEFKKAIQFILVDFIGSYNENRLFGDKEYEIFKKNLGNRYLFYKGIRGKELFLNPKTDGSIFFELFFKMLNEIYGSEMERYL